MTIYLFISGSVLLTLKRLVLRGDVNQASQLRYLLPRPRNTRWERHSHSQIRALAHTVLRALNNSYGDALLGIVEDCRLLTTRFTAHCCRAAANGITIPASMCLLVKSLNTFNIHVLLRPATGGAFVGLVRISEQGRCLMEKFQIDYFACCIDKKFNRV